MVMRDLDSLENIFNKLEIDVNDMVKYSHEYQDKRFDTALNMLQKRERDNEAASGSELSSNKD
jgi:hypothetical protein